MFNKRVKRCLAGLLLIGALLIGLRVYAASSEEAPILLEGAKATYRLELAAPAEPTQAAPRLLVQGAAESWRAELAASPDLAVAADSTEPRILVQGAATSALQFAGDPSTFVAATPALVPRILVQGAATGAQAKLAQPVEPPPAPVDGGTPPVWLWVLLGAVVGGIAVWVLARR